MQLVIDIPQKVYDKALSGDGTVAIWAGYVKNGIPLPKHHGRLIDAVALTEKAPEIQEYLDVLAPTIIEAESEEEE